MIVSSLKVKCDICGTQYGLNNNKIKDGFKLIYQGKTYDVCSDCIENDSDIADLLDELTGENNT